MAALALFSMALCAPAWAIDENDFTRYGTCTSVCSLWPYLCQNLTDSNRVTILLLNRGDKAIGCKLDMLTADPDDDHHSLKDVDLGEIPPHSTLRLDACAVPGINTMPGLMSICPVFKWRGNVDVEPLLLIEVDYFTTSGASTLLFGQTLNMYNDDFGK